MSDKPLLPPATLGVMGGGQLGRMFASAARTMGYNVVILDPDANAPAAHFATHHIVAAYDDPKGLAELAERCQAVTTEFENPPAEALRWLAARVPVRPNAEAVAIAQDRIKEKTFFRDNRFPVGPYAVLEKEADLGNALTAVQFPAILKTARFGYDGKGQITVERSSDLPAAWDSVDRRACVLEQKLPLAKEASVVLARGADGATAVFPLAENRHANGILDVTIVPADVPQHLAMEARDIALRMAAKLDYVGVLAVELFIVRGQLYVNEIAPRPHNSGHFTINACATSQFEQQVRATAGLPLGDAALVQPAVMVNLLGDVWGRHGPSSVPDWVSVLAVPGASLHLYGKAEARRGRKMGHFTICAATRDEAMERAMKLRHHLGIGA